MKEQKIYNQLLKEFKRYNVLNEELFDSPLNNIKKISDTEYIINEDGIKVKFYFRRENDIHFYFNYFLEGKIPDFYFDIHWGWLKDMNNDLKTSKSWLKVTATAPKIINDFIKTNNPTMLKYSHQTDGNDKIYSNERFSEIIKTIFSDKYDMFNVENPKSYIFIRKDISNRYGSSIKKLHINGDMTLEDAHEYWTNPEKRLMEGKMKGIVKNDYKRNKIKRIYYKIHFL